MAADPGFVPIPRNSCREALGLPTNQPIVGYSGGWAANRGTRVLPDAFRKLREQVPGVLLALTGRPPANVAMQPGVLALGYLEDALLPSFVNALDVAAVITTASRFGLYSYPAKLCEAIACEIPVVATSTPPVEWMLQDAPQSLVPADDPDALCAGLSRALTSEGVRYARRPGWKELVTAFDVLLGEWQR
jgi:glycosyltransferase involved in cell wall biosynthesis